MSSVTVTPMPAGFRPLGADGLAAGDAVPVLSLSAPLPPGESASQTFDLMSVAPGSHRLTATAAGSRDTTATADCRTLVEGIPAMRMEVIDLADPVETGGETTYEIRIVNTGSKADEAVTLECNIPFWLDFVSASGPTAHKHSGGSLLLTIGDKLGGDCYTCLGFEPIAELAPKTEAVYRVRVKAAKAGDMRFKATLTSKHLTAPVVKEESTRVYGE